MWKMLELKIRKRFCVGLSYICERSIDLIRELLGFK